MRKLMIAAALVSTTALAVPAAAHPDHRGSHYGRYDYRDAGIERRLGRIQWQIRRAFERRWLTRHEARRLDRELDRIAQRYRHAQRYGLNRHERNRLHRQLERLERRVRHEARDRDRRWRNRDRWDRYDRWDRRDRYDRRDRRRDRDDRWDDDDDDDDDDRRRRGRRGDDDDD
ncbi:MAG: hypothetical protein ACFBQW_02620 [Sphingomonadaceae bacterium]